jgi:ADP-ribose pyrophosphatase
MMSPSGVVYDVQDGQKETPPIQFTQSEITFNNHGKPLNPAGRTGLRGRGLLGKWGPNFAADSLVTKYDSKTGDLHVVLIKRKKEGMPALPGGMTDPGETPVATGRREFEEEAAACSRKGKVTFRSKFTAMKNAYPELRDLVNNKTNEQEAAKAALDYIFDSKRVSPDERELYSGYVDDPRNTDNAWMETTAYHFPTDQFQWFIDDLLEAGDDAAAYAWVNINDDLWDTRVTSPEYPDIFGGEQANKKNQFFSPTHVDIINILRKKVPLSVAGPRPSGPPLRLPPQAAAVLPDGFAH